MAEFSKLIITGAGQALIAKVIAGTGNIRFTKVSTSDTAYEENKLEELTELSGIKQTSLISDIVRTNEVAVKIETAFHNTELTEGYYMRTMGLYAVDPDEGEILYAVTVETSGNCYIPPYNGVTVSGAYVQLITTVGNAEQVSLEVRLEGTGGKGRKPEDGFGRCLCTVCGIRNPGKYSGTGYTGYHVWKDQEMVYGFKGRRLFRRGK